MKGKSNDESEGNSADEDYSDLDEEPDLLSGKKCKPLINFGDNFEEKVEQIVQYKYAYKTP